MTNDIDIRGKNAQRKNDQSLNETKNKEGTKITNKLFVALLSIVPRTLRKPHTTFLTTRFFVTQEMWVTENEQQSPFVDSEVCIILPNFTETSS